jgi:hypothetical protein
LRIAEEGEDGVRYRRFEVSTSGVDEALQGVSTDPFYASSVSTTSGLRIPPVLSIESTPATQPRYLFLLAQRNISRGKTKVRGIRQGLKLGVNISSVDGLTCSEEFLVQTPDFKFIDGNVSWHLVREPNDVVQGFTPSTDGPNWYRRNSSVAAMLYETFTNSNVDPTTGAPQFYDVGLTAYKAPTPENWQPIAGLGNIKDIRFPWNAPTDAHAVEELVEGSCKISLYASVLQTNPTTRLITTFPSVADVYPGGLSPESAFINSFRVEDRSPVIYWRIFGSILFEDSEEDISLRGGNT